MALFPPGKGGGEEVDYGFKGKGCTNHIITDGNGMPLSLVTTPASASERAQVVTLLAQAKLFPVGSKRPRCCPKILQGDKGYDSQSLRQKLRSKGIKPLIAKRVWKNRKQPRGRKAAQGKTRWQVERCFAWMQRKFRRVVVRWERKSKYWYGFLLLAISFMWIDKLISF